MNMTLNESFVNSTPLAVINGIDKMLKIAVLSPNPVDRARESKHILDAFDIIEGLKVLRTYILDTEEMLGKQKYRNTDYNWSEDVKEDITEYFMRDADDKSAALKRRKYSFLFHLVLEPLIDSLAVLSHDEVLLVAERVIDDTINIVENSEVTAHYDDAFVLRKITKREIDIKSKQTRQQRAPKRQRKEYIPVIENEESNSDESDDATELNFS